MSMLYDTTDHNVGLIVPKCYELVALALSNTLVNKTVWR